jgi:hypothetical protein
MIESEGTYCAIERGLSEQIRSIAKRKGVSPDTLVNLWIQEKIQEQLSQSESIQSPGKTR